MHKLIHVSIYKYHVKNEYNLPMQSSIDVAAESATVVIPSGHGEHSVFPVWFLYLPCGQRMHPSKAP